MTALPYCIYTLSPSAAHTIEPDSLYAVAASTCKFIPGLQPIKPCRFNNFQSIILHTGWPSGAFPLYNPVSVKVFETEDISAAAVYSGKRFDLIIINPFKGIGWKNIHIASGSIAVSGQTIINHA